MVPKIILKMVFKKFYFYIIIIIFLKKKGLDGPGAQVWPNRIGLGRLKA
jgi:hypothetical protein